MHHQPCQVIDARLRFAKSNPELVSYAQNHAGAAGASVDDLLRQAIDRVVSERAALPASTPPLHAQPLLRAL